MKIPHNSSQRPQVAWPVEWNAYYSGVKVVLGGSLQQMRLGTQLMIKARGVIMFFGCGGVLVPGMASLFEVMTVAVG